MRAIDVMAHYLVTGSSRYRRLRHQSWIDFGSRDVTVSGGVAYLWGLVGSQAERKALLALAESVPGVLRVADEMIPAY